MKKRHGLTGKLLLSAAAVVGMSAQGADALVVTPTTDATAMVNSILGTGITLVGVPVLTGVANQQGSFTGGLNSVGFESGIVLTSGNINDIPGANLATVETLGNGVVTSADDISTSLATAGDADLDVLAGVSTFDANVLTFDFEIDGGMGGDVFFNYVFGSEEYLNFVGSQFNDAFGFFLDGTNIALLPDMVTPVAINSINPGSNSAFYVNNVNNDSGVLPGATLDISFDGLTTVLTASAMNLTPGTHTISLKVADAADGILDAGVFIQGGTFSNEPPPGPGPGPAGPGPGAAGPGPGSNNPPNGTVPEPVTATLSLLGLGALGIASRRRKA